MDAGDSEDENERMEIEKMNRIENKKKKKSGGFQSMGLTEAVFKGVLFKGYKIPTPIQRKTIPVIMEGRDVVAMARTGSGKTAAFLIPMLEKLKRPDPTGVRGVILSPTRELALQTHKFAKEIGKFTKLKFAVILGGDKIESQFEAMHQNPDVLIATPGRLMHILLEMGSTLNKVQYVVFDEADRLFEMGFKEQLQEILQRLPETRQTLLFSATLPKMIVDFASAGLCNPQLMRLDLDTKLSDMLKLHFLECRSEDKIPVLLHLLRQVVTPSQLTVVFVATRHHVEYINMILQRAGHKCSVAYSTMDSKARQISVSNFRGGVTKVLVVTDLAARGIDIPHLDVVINLNFPAKPKLFLHRVGRVARAGRSGSAYSIISAEEKAHVLDLHLFLGRQLTFPSGDPLVDQDKSGLYGKVPQAVVDFEEEHLRQWNDVPDIAAMAKVASNAYDKYLRSRPVASSESVKRCKSIKGVSLAYHPVFGGCETEGGDEEREKMLKALKSYKSQSLKAKNSVFQVRPNLTSSKITASMLQDKDEQSSGGRKRKVKDEEFYLDYVSKDYQSEKGYMGSAFEQEASSAVVDMQDDEEEERKKKKMVWDRKKKKYVKSGESKVKTESGKKVQGKGIKRDLYKTWLERKKIKHNDDDDEDRPAIKFSHGKRGKANRYSSKERVKEVEKGGGNRPRSELKSRGQIVKKREKSAKLKAFQKKQADKRKKRTGKK